MKSILASFLILVAFVGLAFLEGGSSAVPCGHASFMYCDESGTVFSVRTFRPESWTAASPVVLVKGAPSLAELVPLAEAKGALIVAPQVADAALLTDEVRRRIFDRVREETGARCEDFQAPLRAGL